MIYRLKHKNTTLDFGSPQAAYQFLDNYPPHVREAATVGEITSAEIQDELSNLSTQMSRSASKSSQHYQWLESRVEFYSQALGPIEQYERAIANKVAQLPTVGEI